MKLVLTKLGMFSGQGKDYMISLIFCSGMEQEISATDRLLFQVTNPAEMKTAKESADDSGGKKQKKTKKSSSSLVDEQRSSHDAEQEVHMDQHDRSLISNISSNSADMNTMKPSTSSKISLDERRASQYAPEISYRIDTMILQL
jgi:hypothetical protein